MGARKGKLWFYLFLLEFIQESRCTYNSTVSQSVCKLLRFSLTHFWQKFGESNVFQKKFLPKKCYTLWVWKKEKFLYITHLMIHSVEIIWTKTVHVWTITFLGKNWHYCVKSKKKVKKHLISRNFSGPD